MNPSKKIKVGLSGVFRFGMRLLVWLTITALVLGCVQPLRVQGYASSGTMAVSTPLVRLSSAFVHGGGTLIVSATGLLPNTSYVVGLTDSRGSLRQGYLTVTSDARGHLFTRLTFAEGTPPESTAVGLGLTWDGVIASTPLVIRAPFGLTPTPTSGKPGAVVQLSVTGLEAGTLRVDLDGQVVIGPLTVPEGNYTGSFTVPFHGTAAKPGAKLTATNLIGQGVIGRASTTFNILAPDPSPQPVISGLVISPDPLMPGEPFTLSGRIWPLPSGLSSSSDLNQAAVQGALQGSLAAFVGNGVTPDKTPVSTQIVSLDASGYFTAQGKAPAKQLGNAVLLHESNQLELKFYGKNFAVNEFAEFGGPLDLILSIQALDTLGNPLEGVQTTVTEIPPLLSGTSAHYSGSANNLQEMFCNKDNWVHETKLGTGLAEYFGSGDGIPIHVNPVNQLMLGFDLYGETPIVVEGFNAGIVLHSPTTLSGAEFNPYNFADSTAWTKYDVYADGRGINYSGLGWLPGQPLRIYHEKVWFHSKTTSAYPYGVYNFKGEWIDAYTLTYTFQYVDPALFNPPLAFEMDQAVKLGNATIGGKNLQVFGGFFNLAPIAGDPTINLMSFPTMLRFRFSWDEAKYGPLQHDVRLYLDGADIGTATLTGGLSTPLCSTIGKSPGNSATLQAEVDLSQYQLEIPYPTNLTTGMRILGINFKLEDGTSFTRQIGLRSDSLPDWFLVAENFSARAITFDPNSLSVTFGGKQLNPSDHKYGAGEGEASGDVPNVGYVQNQVKADTFVEQVYIPAQTLNAQAVFSGVNARTLAPDSQALSNKPTTPPAAKGSASDSVHIELYDIPLAFVIMPLYVIAFEDPFGGAIVNGTSGALMEAFATLDMVGDVGPSQLDLTFTPYAQVNMQIWLNINILYGVLGKAEMSFLPSFGLNMPVRFRVPKPAGKSTISIEGVCFSYRGDVYFYFGFLCAPYLGCAVSHKGTKTIYNGTFPSDCTAGDSSMGIRGVKPYGPFPPTPKIKESTATVAIEPLMTHVDLFTTGNGNVAAVWEKNAGSLQVSQFINGTWTPPAEIANVRTNDSAIIAPLSASRNLSMWITTAYATDAELQAQPISVGAKSMYVKSKLLNGSVPMLPVGDAVNVTPPYSGDGQIALGSCPENQTGCPSSGKATAAWLRMKTADAINGGTQLYYATFNGTSETWGTTTAIPQPASASDSQAQVIFNNAGEFKIYFVRDADGLLNTSADRRLYQYSQGDAAATLVGGMPDNLYEFTLASAPNGNVHIAFTRVEGSQVGLMDNRHPLYVGQATSGVFSTVAVKDKYNRAIFAESPSLQFSGSGEANLTYRALGMGPDVFGEYTPYPIDAPGVVYRTGEMAQFPVNFGQQIQYPKYLTHDGAVNWGIDSAVDQLTGKIISISVHTNELAIPVGFGPKKPAQGQLNNLGGQAQAQPLLADEETGIIFTISTDQPQFAIETIKAINPDFQSAGGVYADLGIRNHGAAFAGTGENAVQIVATWDAPYGQGPISGLGVLESLGAGDVIASQIALTLPTSPDLAHTLYVTIAPPSSVQESTLVDNTATLPMGGIPAPQQVMASLQNHNNHAALVTWQMVMDSRVKGYRIYRAPASGLNAGVFTLIGTTQKLDWLDVTAGAGQSYLYGITALGSSGVESPMSQSAKANIAYDTIYLPIVKRQ